MPKPGVDSLSTLPRSDASILSYGTFPMREVAQDGCVQVGKGRFSRDSWRGRGDET